MCGQSGILVGRRTRPHQDMAAVQELFTRLLVLSEHRGPHATGAAWMDASGSHRVLKAPQPASRFVTSAAYAGWLDRVPSTAVLLMGHTRWPTQGTHLDRRNNHPLVDQRGANPILLTHNGNIPQVAQYFKRFGLPRRWGVDSEILVRLARRHADVDGIDVPALLRDMARCAGNIAAVLAWTAHPETVLIIRRDRPLFLAWHQRHRLLAYASERVILKDATAGESGWHMESMSENTALVFSVNALPECVAHDFE